MSLICFVNKLDFLFTTGLRPRKGRKPKQTPVVEENDENDSHSSEEEVFKHSEGMFFRY